MNSPLPPTSVGVTSYLNTRQILLQVEKARQVFVEKGISLEKFEDDFQGDSCVYENADGTSCANKE